MKLYRHLFYRFYQFAIAMGNEGFYPEETAWSLTSLFAWGNIASALILVKIYLPLSKQVFFILLIGISIIFFIVSFSYFVLSWSDKYKSFITEIDREPKATKIKKDILMTIYCVLTLAVYLYMAEL